MCYSNAVTVITEIFIAMSRSRPLVARWSAIFAGIRCGGTLARYSSYIP